MVAAIKSGKENDDDSSAGKPEKEMSEGWFSLAYVLRHTLQDISTVSTSSSSPSDTADLDGFVNPMGRNSTNGQSSGGHPRMPRILEWCTWAGRVR